MRSELSPVALAAGLAAGLVLGVVACRIFVVRRVRRLLAEERPAFAFVTRHVDTPEPEGG